MARLMKTLASSSVLATTVAALIFAFTGSRVCFTLAISFGTISYHFCMRLLVGLLFNQIMKNKADYTKKWFQVRCFEQKIYEKLKVKKWKDKMPVYSPETFDPAVHSWDEIAKAMCQSELVHETIIVLSFVPVIASVWVGDLPVFLITSSLSALLDFFFVVMQRYNRPRVRRLIARQKAHDNPELGQ